MRLISSVCLLAFISCASLKTAANETVQCAVADLSPQLISGAMSALASPSWESGLDSVALSAAGDVGYCAIAAAVTAIEAQAASNGSPAPALYLHPASLTVTVPLALQCARGYAWLESRRIRVQIK